MHLKRGKGMAFVFKVFSIIISNPLAANASTLVSVFGEPRINYA